MKIIEKNGKWIVLNDSGSAVSFHASQDEARRSITSASPPPKRRGRPGRA